MKKKNNPKKLLGNHQKCWMWGRNAVLETLRAGVWEIIELYLADRLPPDEIEEATALTNANSTPFFIESSDLLERKCHAPDHQGYLAKMAEFPYSGSDKTIATLPPKPLILMMDGIHDPHNFGAMIRSADAFGVDAVWIGTEGQTGVTSQAARSSAGAVNRIPIVRVTGLIESIPLLKERGMQLIGANEKAETPIHEIDWTVPTVAIIGNEGRGIRQEVLTLCDRTARIPQRESVGSLNAAAAAAVILYEAQRQRLSSRSIST